MAPRQVIIIGTLVEVGEAPSNPPGIWGGAGQPFPTPPIPIYPGGTPNPPGIWGPTDPFPGYGLPGAPPVISGPPGPWPTPPIHLPPPLGIWGPTDPRPGWGLPPEGPGKPPGSGIEQPPTVTPPVVGVPVEGYIVFVLGRGYVFVPSGAVPTPPPGEPVVRPPDFPTPPIEGGNPPPTTAPAKK